MSWVRIPPNPDYFIINVSNKSYLVFFALNLSIDYISNERYCYNYSFLLSIPLALLTGIFTVTSQEVYKKIRMQSNDVKGFIN